MFDFVPIIAYIHFYSTYILTTLHYDGHRGLTRMNRKNKIKNRYHQHLNQSSKKNDTSTTAAATTDGSNATERARLFRSDSTQDASCRFILQEYGGIDDPFLVDDMDGTMDDHSSETNDTTGPTSGSGTDDSSQGSTSSSSEEKEKQQGASTTNNNDKAMMDSEGKATTKVGDKVPASPSTTTTNRKSLLKNKRKSSLKKSKDAAATKSSDTEPATADTSNNNDNLLRQDNYDYVPPEFTSLSNEAQLQLTEMLSWESIQQWDFDVFELNKTTNGHPLLFMGWAILGSSHAQRAMRKQADASLGPTTLKLLEASIADNGEDDEGYGFVEEFQIPMDKLCNYMRVIESDYSTENAYHNAIHAADVMQTLHTLIQQSNNNNNNNKDSNHKLRKQDDAVEAETFSSPSLNVLQHCSKLHLFAILLSALVHDVDHNGKTNAFHVQVKSELAVLYNDKSVLENWHIAHAFSRLLNMDLKQQYLAIAATAAASVGTTNASSQANNTNESKLEETIGESPNNFLCNVTTEQFMAIRKLMIEAVLNTDMVHHFQNVNAARGMLLEYKEEQERQKDDEEEGITKAAAAASAKKQEELSWKMLEYMMHLADISSQAKAAPIFYQWTRRCLEEFFAQGDKEASLGLPISLLCDRATTSEPESQIGFIRFVVEPAFGVLGGAIPFVKDTVMTIIHNNLEHWTKEADKEKAEAKLEKAASKQAASKATSDVENGKVETKAAASKATSDAENGKVESADKTGKTNGSC